MSKRAIIMPIGTTIGGTASASPVTLFDDQVGVMYVDGSNNLNLLTCGPSGYVELQFAASNYNAAYTMLVAIQNFLYSKSGGPYVVIPPPVFSSVAPSSASGGARYVGLLYGQYMVSNGINGIKLDSGSQVYFTTINKESDPLIAFTTLFNVTSSGTYTVYFSQDLGNTWTTTGLTVTIS